MDAAKLEAYPQYIFYLATLMGLFLFSFNPRWLFYAVLASLTTMDLKAYYFTRWEGSAYFNLFDLNIAMGLAASILIQRDPARRIPVLWHWMTLDLFLGCFVALFALGVNYDSIRAMRYAINLPILWLIAFRCVNSREDARIFLRILLIGGLIQSMRQCYFVAFFASDAKESDWRTIRYLNSGLVVLPLCFLMQPVNLTTLKKLFLYICFGLSTVALVLTQTRSLWMPQAAVLLAAGLTSYRRQLIRTILPCVAVCLLCAYAMSKLAPNSVNVVRVFLSGHATNFTSGTGRENVLTVEVDEWLDGNWLLGRGIGYFYSVELNEKYSHADWWGHIGYIAYLSQLGLVGLYLYGFAYPKLAFTRARMLWKSADPEMKQFGFITACLTLFAVLSSCLTTGLLLPHAFSMLILTMGAACSLAYNVINEDDESSDVEQLDAAR